MKTIDRAILKGRIPTDNITFNGGTYRLGAGSVKPFDADIVLLAKTNRGKECVEPFTKYKVIDS